MLKAIWQIARPAVWLTVVINCSIFDEFDPSFSLFFFYLHSADTQVSTYSVQPEPSLLVLADNSTLHTDTAGKDQVTASIFYLQFCKSVTPPYLFICLELWSYFLILTSLKLTEIKAQH